MYSKQHNNNKAAKITITTVTVLAKISPLAEFYYYFRRDQIDHIAACVSNDHAIRSQLIFGASKAFTRIIALL